MSDISPPLFKKRQKQTMPMLEAIFSHSPYLSMLYQKYHGVIPSLDSTYENDEALSKALREYKAKAALITALKDLSGEWGVMETTQYLTQIADKAINAALNHIIADCVANKVMSDLSGLFVLAMGKMGAYELNYSSDIDLILFFDPAKLTIRDDLEVSVTFERIAKRLIKLIHERNEYGYVFRVDVRLRPDPSSTPIVISTRQALQYYESIGQTWERSAYIKARVCAGDRLAGEAFLRDLHPFIWRKYLDHASIAEIYEMKEQINSFKGFSEVELLGHNVKLGRGGIREIEFFVQAQQLLLGGRNAEMRHNQTLVMLQILVKHERLDAKTAEKLSEAYIFLRQIEHRLQMLQDLQTHDLPNNITDLVDFSRFCGFKTYQSFEKTCLKHLQFVHQAYENLFKQGENSSDLRLDFSSMSPKPNTMSHLLQLGFMDAKGAYNIIHAWKSQLKSRRLKEELEPLLPMLLTHFGREGEPDLALLAFDKLITKARHPLDLVMMLKRDAALPRLFALILSASPRLSQQITRRAHVLDGLFEPAFYKKNLDKSEVQTALASTLALARDDEDFMDRMRLFGQEQLFTNSIKALSGTIELKALSGIFTDLADIFIKVAFQKTQDLLHSAHGYIQNEQFAVLALGKCGSGEMSVTSDLDLIILYDYDDQNPMSNGIKPLHASQYFAKFAQKLINILTAPTNVGQLYEADLRLRPSGKSGPIATRITSFKEYQQNEAWVWELMALTRARLVMASDDFGDVINKTIKTVLIKKRDPAKIIHDLSEMRQAIADNFGEDKSFTFKYAKGGLIDIEFIAQGLQLIHAAKYHELLLKNTGAVIERAAQLSLIDKNDAATLLASLKLQTNLNHILKISVEGQEYSKGLQKLLVRISEQPDFERLTLTLLELQEATREIFNRLFTE